MVDCINKVILIGNVGDDPVIVDLVGGSRKLASFSLATSHSWIDQKTRERKSHTDWHRIVVYGEGLVGIIQKTGVKKGSKLCIEGRLVNRKWIDSNGSNRATIEVVLQGYNCSLVNLNATYNNYNNNSESDDDFSEYYLSDEFEL